MEQTDKKAYAEIIWNTAKEAAARITVSERKARELNHQLSSTKDEALLLLLRLKQNLDYKINEAEVRSLDQQRKIEELEAQLHEAEDIVSSLRAELTEANTKLDAIENNQFSRHPKLVKNAVSVEENLEYENRPFEAVSACEAKQISQGINELFVADNILVDNGYSAEPDVPSIIMKRKKPEVFRNKCTQRIRACGGNLLRGHSTIYGGPDHLKIVEALGEDRLDEKICMMAPVDANSMCAGKEKPASLKEVQDEDNTVLMQALKLLRKKRSKAAGHRRSNVSRIKRVSHVAEEACSALSESPSLLPCSRGMRESDCEDMSEHAYSPSSTPSDVSKMVAPEHLLGFESDDKLTDGCKVFVNKDKKWACNLVVTTQRSCGGNVNNAGSQTELEVKDLSIVNLDVKKVEACNRFSSTPPKDRILKYTFQRKREKESVVGDDSSSMHQENPFRKRKLNKQISVLEPGNICAVAESSPDSPWMAHVEQQMITLPK